LNNRNMISTHTHTHTLSLSEGRRVYSEDTHEEGRKPTTHGDGRSTR
jgi:hypothetical protein